MSLLSSYIFNSELLRGGRFGGAVSTAVWIVFGLVTIDIMINILFAYPTDPRIINPSQLQLYFDYGRSIEAKLARMTRADPALTAPITLAGWYDPIHVDESVRTTQAPVVTVYGMSHAVRLAQALERTTDRFNARVVAAPGATGNWSYGAFLRDLGRGKSRAVVLSLMSANLSMITTMSPMTWNIAFPMPYTQDRFFIENDQLRVVQPPYTSFEQYVQTFNSPIKWADAQRIFSLHDPMYSPFVMHASVTDHSSLFRLIRRAYGQRLERDERKGVLDRIGYDPASEQLKVANAIVKEFSFEARRGGVIPIVFLVNNLGYSDFLFQGLRATLEAHKIPYLSSHSLVSPSDPRGYLPDSHFTDENDDRLARALSEIIEANHQ